MTARYSIIAIILHWVMAALLLFMIWLGWNMDDNEVRFQLHKSIGITLLIVTVARVLWRVFNKPPALPEDVSPRDKRLSEIVQFGFYALMILLPLGGWAAASTSPFAVPTVLYETVSWPHLPLPLSESLYQITSLLHEIGGKTLLVLLALHVAGAIKHEITDESGVLKRMVPRLFGRVASPTKSRGAWTAFGGAIAVFAAIAAIPLIATGASTLDDGAAEAVSTNYEMLSGTITFSGTHDGNAFSGTFDNFTPSIEFYREDVSRSAVVVSVNLQDITVSKKLYKDSLMAPEWFDVKRNSVAIATLNNFRPNGGDYAGAKWMADLALTLKDQTVTTPFKFRLFDDADGSTHMTGETQFTRTSLNLGLESDPTADWVSEEITVSVDLLARAN